MSTATTAVILLGHSNLTHGKSAARADVCHALRLADASSLGRLYDGQGHYDGHAETCDAWVVQLHEPDDTDYLALVLSGVAKRHGQTAIGFIVQDPARESIVCAR